jgi:hypothetical protein
MKIYLDNCCFNRPYDDQSHIRIRLEAEAKFRIQEEVRAGIYELVWSYILDYENSKNPFRERREQISKWAKYAQEDKVENKEILDLAQTIQGCGMKKIDSLHIACAINAGADYFLTTDDLILKKSKYIESIKVTDPIGFVKEELP